MHTDGFHIQVGRGGCFRRAVRLFRFLRGQIITRVIICHRDRTSRQATTSTASYRQSVQKTTLQNRSGTPQTVRDDVRIVQKTGQQRASRDDEQGQGGRDSHPRECAAGSMGRVLSRAMEAARAELIPEFSCSRRAIVGTQQQRD